MLFRKHRVITMAACYDYVAMTVIYNTAVTVWSL